MKNNKQCKYRYLIVLQGRYNNRWEDLVWMDSRDHEINRISGRRLTATEVIRRDYRSYQQNEGGCYRIIKRRQLAE